MTFAAGIMCSDGIVMCADSQETAGDLKWPVNKLAFPKTTLGDFHILIAGAGFGSAIDAASQKIFDRTAMSGYDHDQTRRVIQEVLREVHEKDLQYYPTNDLGTLQFRLLIAFSAGGHGGLFVTDGSLLVRVETFQVIGSGDITNFFAHLLYKKSPFWSTPDMDTVEGSVFAAFLAYLAKSQLTSIGGNSQIAVLTSGGLRFANIWEIPAWESAFPKLLKIAGGLMLDCANPYIPEQEFKEILEKHSAALSEIKRIIAQERERWDRLWHDAKSKGVHVWGHTPRPSDSEKSEDQQ
jgi:20S proteasome alpha/beta subunit